MSTTNNHQIDQATGIAITKETLKTPSDFQVYQETAGDGELIRYFIDYVKRTGDFDYRSFEVEEDLSLSPEQEQRLVRLYIEYIKRTGEFDYPMLLNSIESANLQETNLQETNLQATNLQATSKGTSSLEELKKTADNEQEQSLSLTPVQSMPSVKESETKGLQEYCEEIQAKIIPTCLSFKTLLNQWVESLRPTNSTQTETRLRALMEQIPQTEEHSFLIYDLKMKHQQLAKCLNCLLNLAYKHAKALETLPFNISRRSIDKVISDLAYILLYLEENAQVTKIQQEIFLAYDPSIYLRRLNQYLDILPDLMVYLIHALENLMANQSLREEEENLV
jgi:hypothetical protein